MTAQPDRVKVRCANPQPTLAGPCTWSGTRVGRLITTYHGRTFREDPTRKRCPQCGGPVTQAERDRARDLLGPPATEPQETR